MESKNLCNLAIYFIQVTKCELPSLHLVLKVVKRLEKM
jgi:hypothetical protein